MINAYGEERKDNLECDYCHKLFKIKAEKGITYKGIDEHHNPPKFMVEKWNGKTYYLCRKHHRKLHDKIIKILQKYSPQLKKVKSEYWTWIYILEKDRKECCEEVIQFTLNWLKEENGNPT